MKTLLLFLSLVVAGSACAQDSYIDSRKAQLEKKIHDTTRARIYVELAEHIIEEDEWLAYNEKALGLANKKLKKAKGDERKYYLKIKASSVGNNGYYYDEHGDTRKALELYFESLELYDDAGEVKDKANILNNIGLIFKHQGDFESAFEYLNDALQVKLKYNPTKVSRNYLNLGSTKAEIGDSIEAFQFYKKALEAAKKINDDRDMATAYHNMGSHQYSQHKYLEAKSLYYKAINHYSIAQDTYSVGWSKANLGSCFINLNQLDSAEICIKEAAEISEAYKIPKLESLIAERMYDLHATRSEWKEALKYYQKSVRIEDSLNQAWVNEAAFKKKLEYEYNLEKTKSDAEREREKEIDNQRLLFTLIGLVFLVVFTIFILLRLRVSRRQNKIIEHQKTEVESQKNVIEEKNFKIVDSINAAKRLQDAILPDAEEVVDAFKDAFLIYLPKDIVAGDFYWLYQPDKDTIYIAAADCTGHGVPGAMVSVICSHALDRTTKEFGLSDPGKILDKTTELVIERFRKSNEEVKNGMDISLCKLNLKSNELHYAGAYNSMWVKRFDKDELESVKGNRQPVGNFDHRVPFTTHKVKLKEGDWVYLHSDGYADQFGGPQGKKYRKANLKRLLTEGSTQNGAEQKSILLRNFKDWKGNLEQIDDICLIGFKI
jgi:serine phosphatase RsbU (regulator of sigma subunit)/Tfp pilus assembly protein PilF